MAIMVARMKGLLLGGGGGGGRAARRCGGGGPALFTLVLGSLASIRVAFRWLPVSRRLRRSS